MEKSILCPETSNTATFCPFENQIQEPVSVSLVFNGTTDPNFLALKINVKNEYDARFYGFVEIEILCRTSVTSDFYKHQYMKKLVIFSKRTKEYVIDKFIPRTALLNDDIMYIVNDSLTIMIKFQDWKTIKNTGV